MTDTTAKLRVLVEAVRGARHLIDDGVRYAGSFYNMNEHSNAQYIRTRLADFLRDAPALLAQVERLQSLEQMLIAPGEDVIRDMCAAYDKQVGDYYLTAQPDGMKAAIAVLRKKAGL